MNRKIVAALSAFILALSLSSCTNDTEIKSADDYKDTYPDVYATYQANADMSETKFGGSVQVDYL